MDYFEYRDGRLHAEEVPVEELAGVFGTPLFVYSRATLERHWHAFDRAFTGHDHLVCYAVKANANLGVLSLLARLGSGFDIVSGGELARVQRAGGQPPCTVFSGVGKSAAEMRQALTAGIFCFNVESEAELQRLDTVAGETRSAAPVALRVNPDVDAGTHPYIATGLRDNKFGLPISQATDLYRRGLEFANIQFSGIACHIGSQLTEVAPFIDALDRVLDVVDTLKQDGIGLQHLDLGGGLGIRYRDETPPLPDDYAAAVIARLRERNPNLRLVIEPGRAIAGNAGVLLTRIEYIKTTPEKNFAVVDAAMNDLLRPSLYDAWHEILPATAAANGAPRRRYDVVGPVCESADFLGKDRELTVAAGDLLVVRSAGAYAATMSSNYNSRPRAAEVMVDGDRYHLVRERESVEQLMAGERVVPA